MVFRFAVSSFAFCFVVAAKAFCVAIDSPPAHGALGIGFVGLLEGTDGLEVPEVVEEVEALLKPEFCVGAGGSDVDGGIAGASHQVRRQWL